MKNLPGATDHELDAALAHHRAGRLEQADSMYLRMPDNSDALHLRGVLAHQQNRHSDALELMHRAIEMDPRNAAYYFSIELVYRALNRLEDAQALYRQFLRMEPCNALVHTNLGNLLKAQERFDEAIASYRTALTLDPSYAVAHSNLGSALAAQGRTDEAVACYEHALKFKPNFVEGRYNLAGVLKAQGKLDEAVGAYRRALAFRPDFVDAHMNLGSTLAEQGKLDEAITSFRQAIALKPDSAESYNNLGNALKKQGKLDDAIACYRQALAYRPDFVEAHNNLGNAFVEQKQLDDAVACYRQAIALKPDFAKAHGHLGNALKEQGKFDDALACFHTAIRLVPNDAEARLNLGNCLRAQEKFGEALTCYLDALAIKPDYAQAYNNLGIALIDNGKTEDAVQCYQKAIELKPDFFEAFNNLGAAFNSLGKLDEAIRNYELALALVPDYAEAYDNLGVVFHKLGRPDDAINCFLKAVECKPDFSSTHNNLLLMMQYSASYTPEDVLAQSVAFAEQFETALRPAWPGHANLRDAAKRLKIGYVSPDLCRHSVAFFIEPVLASHDREQVEVFCYYNNTLHDPVTDRLQALADHWIPCKYMSDDQLAARIRADGIDILIDLAGHSGGNRLLTFARKPAPLAVTWLGYPATTGLSAIDYRLTDSFAEPPGMTEGLNVEGLWRLPNMFSCYRAYDNSPDVIDHPPLLDHGYLTFGCFNNFSKVTDPVLSLWASILRKLPTARLMLEIPGVDDLSFRTEVEARLAGLGLPLERVLLEARRSQNQYVLYNRIDLALDPFPCNGGTTSMDALWMGVPFITLAGRHFSSRLGVTVLSNAGLAELIAQSEEEYVELAVALASDLPRLTALRAGLRHRVQASPAMDAPRFTRNLELAYRGMWQEWCKAHDETSDPLMLNAAGNNFLTQGLVDQAIASFHAALAIQPRFAEAHANLGICYARQGDLEKALACFQRATAEKPDFAEAHNDQGTILAQLGRLDEAVPCYRKALALSPRFAEAHYNMGRVQKDQGKLNDAIVSYQAALASQPHMVEAYVDLGIAWLEQGKSGEAIACYQQALALKPDYAEAHNNLGIAYHELGRLDEAIASHTAALQYKPEYAEAHYNLGNDFRAQGRLDDAAGCYFNAIAYKPAYADAFHNLGTAFGDLGKFNEAIDCYQTSLALEPGSAKALSNLGNIYHKLGRTREALACQQEVLERCPDYANAHHIMLLALQYSADHTPEEVFARHVAFAKQFEAPLRAHWQHHANARDTGNTSDTGKRLKIGYVSPDFRRHSVAYFIEPVLACHDKSQVEVFCYYNGTQQDAVTVRLQALADHWIACQSLSDEALAARIRDDGIDILIDLAGHTGGNRLLTFARKPAPVQVTWLGYPSTTGLAAIDYRLTDAYAEPPGMTESLNVEQLWRLPDMFCCYRASGNAPAVIDHPPCLDNGYFTFGCFNHYAKVTDPVLALWARILQRLPQARLMLEIAGLEEPAFRAEVEARMVQLGLPLERLILEPRHSQNQYVLYNRIDLALDPFPCNGGTTSMDSLWMGVPFITLAGHHYSSRLGVTVLGNAGLSELIAHSEKEYVELAVGLGTDLPGLAALRANLRERVQASPAMDAGRFTRFLEQAYRGMWEVWCKKSL